MAYENLIFDINAVTNKGMTRDFAVLAYLSSLLNLYVRANLGPVSDRASIDIAKVIYRNSLAKISIFNITILKLGLR